MTELRRRMIQDMDLRGLCQGTKNAYIWAIVRLCRHYPGRRPEDLTERQVHEYLTYLHQERKQAKSTIAVAFYAIKFLYGISLERRWHLLNLLRVRGAQQKLPGVLSLEEVTRLLAHIRHPVARMVAKVMYACGLRVSEATGLQVCQIDSARMVLRITGKGGKQREVLLPAPTLQALREYWKAQRPPKACLFPGKDGRPIHPDTIRQALRAAGQEAGLRKRVHPHMLRHSYATHLLERRVDIRTVQVFLGHRTLNTTVRYLHLTASTVQATRKILDEFMGRL